MDEHEITLARDQFEKLLSMDLNICFWTEQMLGESKKKDVLQYGDIYFVCLY